MAQSNWEADKMLDVYIYDYLVKRNLQTTAKAFMAEGKVAADPVAIDAPGGFLFEWWSVFWDIFIARTNEKHSEVAAAYIEAQQAKAREHEQQLQMQQIQLMQQRHAQLQRNNPNHPSLSGPINNINSDGILGTSTASVLAAKMYEERLKHPHSMESEASTQLLDASRMALLKSAGNHPGQLVHGNQAGVSAALQQIQNRTQQTTDIKTEGNLGVTQRSLPMDPSSIYGQGIIQAKSGLGGPGDDEVQAGSGAPARLRLGDLDSGGVAGGATRLAHANLVARSQGSAGGLIEPARRLRGSWFVGSGLRRARRGGAAQGRKRRLEASVDG